MFHAEAISRHHDVLQRCTTINFYVIDYLIAEDVLDEAQEHDLKTERNPLKQRILIFQWLKEVPHDKYESFLQVMKDTEQQHVANLLRGSTEEDHLPLSDARYRRLVKIRHKMANVTRVDGEVIAELRSLQAVSMTDAEEIRAEKVESTKVSKLISAIMRRCNYSYNSFQKVLIKTLQTAAANFLSQGEMPAVHMNSNRSDLDEPLSQAFNDLIRSKATDDADIRYMLADLDRVGLNPVKATPGQSIVIFIYCKTVDDAVNFTQVFNTGRLQRVLDIILNRLLLTIEPENSEGLDSRISLRDDDIVSLEEFTGNEDWVRKDLMMPKPSRKIFVCDATTQTDKVPFLKKMTGWIKESVYRSKPSEQYRVVREERKPYERYMVSSMFSGDINDRKLSGVKGLLDTREEMITLRNRVVASLEHGAGRIRGKSSENEGDFPWQSLRDRVIGRKAVETRSRNRLTILLVLLLFSVSLGLVVYFYSVTLSRYMNM